MAKATLSFSTFSSSPSSPYLGSASKFRFLRFLVVLTCLTTFYYSAQLSGTNLTSDQPEKEAPPNNPPKRTLSEINDVHFRDCTEFHLHHQRNETESSKTSESLEEVFKPTNHPSHNGPPPYAYMFLVGGVDPATNSYRGFVYNAMIAADILQKQGSKSDVWLFLELSPDSNAIELPTDEADVLKALNVHVHYMKTPETTSFDKITMEKFQLLNLTQYRRVMFLDGDVLPLINMDYLMELSDGERPLVQPNFIVATSGEPANAGCFMLEPKPGFYEELLQIIKEKEKASKGRANFNRIQGWGHDFRKHADRWQGIKGSGDSWFFHGAQIDQGLLYYYTKYHRQAVTIFRGMVVENWVAGKDGKPVLQASMDPSWIDQYAPMGRVAYQFSCDKKKADEEHLCVTPYSNFAHFMGSRKPWQQGYSSSRMSGSGTSMMNAPYRVWFSSLFDLSKRFGLGITPENVDERFKATSPLGYKPGDISGLKRNQASNVTA